MVESNSTNWCPLEEKTKGTFAGGVLLRLLQAVGGRVLLGLGLDEGNGYLPRACFHGQAKCVVNATLSPAPGLAPDDIHRPIGHFAANEVFTPALGVESRVDQLGAGVGLAERHTGL